MINIPSWYEIGVTWAILGLIAGIIYVISYIVLKKNSYYSETTILDRVSFSIFVIFIISAIVFILYASYQNPFNLFPICTQ